MGKLLVAEKIPDWLKNLPADAGLSRKREFFLDGQSRKFWYARTIRNEIRRRQRETAKP